MPTVYIPSLLRHLTAGQDTVTATGATVGAIIDSLDQSFPGMKDRLCDGDRLRSGISVVVDTEVSRLGLRHPLEETSEVHFLPQIAGG
jgi:molybdopterin synthase sulfur carrier subunit